MRRILVDHTKTLHRVQRGGGAAKLTLDDSLDDAVAVSQIDPVRMIDLDNALTQLDRQDARKARLIELIYFGGLSGEEAAEVLGVSLPAVIQLKDSSILRHKLSLPAKS